MRRALYASGGAHLGLLAALVAAPFFASSPEPDFDFTEVSLLTAAEFDAMFETFAPTPVIAPPAPLAPALEPEATTPPQAEAPAPETTPPEAAPEPVREPVPDVSALQPPPETVVDDTPPTPFVPPAGDPSAAPSDTPTPNQAPRVAPMPAPAPEPDVEIAPEIVTRPEPSESATAPAPDQPETAPEEASTEIVTEAETPSASLAPVTSMRPPTRPSRPARPIQTVGETPTPDAEPNVPERDPMADAIAAAVASAVSEAVAAPAGPPLSRAQQDGLRVAVQDCWSIGSLSTEAMATVVTLTVEFDRDARPILGSIRLAASRGGSDTAVRQAYEAARRAVIRCGASGYGLPIESYDHWRIIDITFNPEEMRLR